MFLLPVETLTERRPLSYGAPPERGMRLHTVPLRDCGFRTKRLSLWETPWNDEDNIGRFRVQQRQAFADTRRRIARIRFHRAQQRGQVIAYQHADRQRFARQGPQQCSSSHGLQAGSINGFQPCSNAAPVAAGFMRWQPSVVDITVARRRRRSRPYARFAQKYFRSIGAARRQRRPIRSVRRPSNRYDPVVTRTKPESGPLPAPHTEIYADTGSAEEFRGYFPTAAAPPATAWRMRRGDATPRRYSTCASERTDSLRAIMPSGLWGRARHGSGTDRPHGERMPRTVFGKRSVTTYTVRYYVVPGCEAITFIMPVPVTTADYCLPTTSPANPVVLECRPQGSRDGLSTPAKRTPRSDEAGMPLQI